MNVVSLSCPSQLSAEGRKRIGISEWSFQKRNLGMRYTFKRYQVLKLGDWITEGVKKQFKD